MLAEVKEKVIKIESLLSSQMAKKFTPEDCVPDGYEIVTDYFQPRVPGLKYLPAQVYQQIIFIVGQFLNNQLPRILCQMAMRLLLITQFRKHLI